MGKSSQPISKTSLQVIKRSNEEFSEQLIQLGNNLCNHFSRGDITAALTGDKDKVQQMGLYALRKGWVENLAELPNIKPDFGPILQAIEWMRIMRSATSSN